MLDMLPSIISTIAYKTYFLGVVDSMVVVGVGVGVAVVGPEVVEEAGSGVS